MILFLTLLYVAVLLILVKLKLVPWNLWAKISPLIWSIFLMIVLFMRLQFYAPSGPAEVTFKVLPGQVFKATVEMAVPGNAMGQIAPSGNLMTPRDVAPLPFAVRLQLEDESIASQLPAGTTGTVAICTGRMSAIYVIRRVMVWMDAWMNYIVPF